MESENITIPLICFSSEINLVLFNLLSFVWTQLSSVSLSADAETAHSTIQTVTIHITDANDNPPTFLKDEYWIKVREDLPVGSVVTNLIAQDADLPETGGGVHYKIMKGKDRLFLLCEHLVSCLS